MCQLTQNWHKCSIFVRALGVQSRVLMVAKFESSSPIPILKEIYFYPVKGLCAQPVSSIDLIEGKPFPNDRQFALARPGVPLQADNPKWAKKGLFVMRMLEEALAKVQTHLDPSTLRFDILSCNQRLLSINLDEPEGRTAVEAFFRDLVPTLPAAPTLIRSHEGHFMDKPDNVVSLINFATVRSLEKQWRLKLTLCGFHPLSEASRCLLRGVH